MDVVFFIMVRLWYWVSSEMSTSVKIRKRAAACWICCLQLLLQESTQHVVFNLCAFSLSYPFSFYLVSYIPPESPSTSLGELGWTFPIQTCIHAGESAWRGTTVKARKLVFPLVFPEEHKKLGSSLKCQTYYTLVYEAGLWVEKVLDDLHLAQQTTPLCVWWIKKQKPTPEISLAGGLKPDCGCCVEQCHCNTKLKGKLFPTFLENMGFSLSPLSWMRKWTPLSCLYTQRNAMASRRLA